MVSSSKAHPKNIASGTPCLRCRKRRVKCDSTRPSCQRCMKDGMECQGYEKQLKIVPYRPRQASQTNRRHWPSKNILETTVPHVLSSEDDELAMLDSIQCYNKYIVPANSPAYRPFKRQEIQPDVPWQILPKILWYLIILTSRSMQSAKNGLEPLSQRDVCHYRGLSLRELKGYLPDALIDPYAIALGSVLMLMGTDLHSSENTSWVLHFQAATKIIALRGGLRTCLASLPLLQAPLINYMLADILTATTCGSAFIFLEYQSLQDHIGYMTLLPNLEADILGNSCACPVTILQAITRTNIMRGSSQASSLSHVLLVDETALSAPAEFEETLSLIDTFDPNSWAIRMIEHGAELPDRSRNLDSLANLSAFVSLGHCYKAASLIYLVLSCSHFSGGHLLDRIHSAALNFKEHSHLLFATGSHDNNGPLHQQLWRFLTWPMVISTYAHVGWSISKDENSAEIELDRLRTRATTLKCRRLLGAVQHLRVARGKRIKDLVKPWSWDDGFSTRCAFGV